MYKLVVFCCAILAVSAGIGYGGGHFSGGLVGGGGYGGYGTQIIRVKLADAKTGQYVTPYDLKGLQGGDLVYYPGGHYGGGIGGHGVGIGGHGIGGGIGGHVIGGGIGHGIGGGYGGRIY